MSHKSGFVNILGNPNVGKSTIMNALVGEKLSIITSKAQTTRHRIMGIVNGDDFQIVYSDTPGILKPNYKLQETMMGFVNLALTDADTIIYVTDVVEKSAHEGEYIKKIKSSSIPVIVVINKIDLSNQSNLEKTVETWREIFPESPIIPVSALENFNLDALLNAILSKLPEGEPWFPKDQLTDKIERFFASEILREKILLNYQKEIPYSVEIEIEEFKEEKTLIRIRALIHVARQTQKGIIIGHKGLMLKKIATEARVDM
jgi:GTP-binding protein Era